MDNEVLKDIIRYARIKLTHKYGYCGVAEGSDSAMLNSDDGSGMDIIISLKCKPEDEPLGS